jgi:hypothetical protein
MGVMPLPAAKKIKVSYSCGSTGNTNMPDAPTVSKTSPSFASSSNRLDISPFGTRFIVTVSGSPSSGEEDNE